MLDERFHDRYIIDTPEHIEFGYDVAGLGPRLLAALVDHGIIFGMIYAIYWISDQVFDAAPPGELLLLSSYSLLIICYYILFERFWAGQTAGKRLLGIRVVQEHGHPVTLAGSMVRNLIRLVDILPFSYFIGTLSTMIDGRARRLGDIAAGTIIVNDRITVTLDELLAESSAYLQEQEDEEQLISNLSSITAEDLDLVISYLQQREQLHPARRQYLLTQITYRIFSRLGYSVPGDQERFLEQILLEHPLSGAARKS